MSIPATSVALFSYLLRCNDTTHILNRKVAIPLILNGRLLLQSLSASPALHYERELYDKLCTGHSDSDAEPYDSRSSTRPFLETFLDLTFRFGRRKVLEQGERARQRCCERHRGCTSPTKYVCSYSSICAANSILTANRCILSGGFSGSANSEHRGIKSQTMRKESRRLQNAVL